MTTKADKPKRGPLNKKKDATGMQEAMDAAMRKLHAKTKPERPHGTYQKVEHAPKHHR